MKKSTKRIVIRAVIALTAFLICFFAVQKLVTNHVEQGGQNVGGQVTESTSETTTEPVPTPSDPADSDTLSKIKKLGAEEFIKQYAEENGISFEEYPEFVVELVEKNPTAADFALAYPTEKYEVHEIDLSEYKNSQFVPLFIQWDKRWGYIEYGSSIAAISGCGPVCLSMVAFYLTGDESMSPDKIIKFATENGYCVPGNGTSWTLISEGAKKLGLSVKELPLNENLVRQNLQNGKPIICVMGPGDFTTTGHYIVLTEYEDGYVSVNDPNSLERSQKVWKFSEIQDQIRNLWALDAK